MGDNGAFPYGPEGKFGVGQTDITVFSPGKEVRAAYPKMDKALFKGWKNTPYNEAVKDMYYKK